MSEKKTVNRNIAIILGVLVIILLVSLVATIYYYSNLTGSNGETSSLQAQLNSANSQIASLQAQLNSANSQIASLQAQLNSANSQIQSLEAIVNLQQKSTLVNDQTINQPPNSYTYWYFNVQYAGYIVVYVYSSTTTNTYVEVLWSYNGISYDQSINVGASGTAAFPVLPTSVEVRVGNTNFFNGATETVSIIYVY